MTKEEYINANYDNYLYYWSNIAIGFGFFVILSLIPLDYLVSPSNFKDFLFYRILTSLCFLVMYFLNKRKVSRKIQSGLSVFAGTIVAIMIALMIAKFGGHQSVYFAGIILLIIYVFGLIPFQLKTSLIASVIIYSIYLLPIINYDIVTNKPFFISANIFILSCSFTLLLLRYLSHKRLIKEFGLQYDLDQQKEQLQVYSQQLEDLVAERTKELSISEQRYRELFENANDGIVVFDKDRTIFNVNQKFCELHGFEKDALIGKDIGLLESENTEDKINERMNRLLSGEAIVFETEHKRKDGGRILLEISSKGIEIGGELYIQSFHRDITEKKRLQEQLFQSQKMESVGLLAGGIAHDFNNILTAILGHTEILHEFDNLDVDARQRVKIIENSARRAGQLVSQLLSFARKSTIEILPINLNAVIRDTGTG
jgi:PAS domain S-box-containing protein